MRDTLEFFIHKTFQTLRNMRNANRLVADLENLRAFCDALISSHRIDLDNLRFVHARALAELTPSRVAFVRPEDRVPIENSHE
jgi:hypothetical protein